MNLKNGINNLLKNPEVDSIDDLDEIKVHQKNGNIITLPKEEEKKFKVGEHNMKDEWNKQINSYKAPNGEVFTGQDAYDNAYLDFLAAAKDLENYEVGSEGHKRHMGYLGNALKYLTNYWKNNKGE